METIVQPFEVPHNAAGVHSDCGAVSSVIASPWDASPFPEEADLWTMPGKWGTLTERKTRHAPPS
jgi:hypothetical protein